jgi:Flp pilus assembly secretin CpaC
MDGKEQHVGLHNNSDLNRALLGEEVIIEAMLLSKCNFLIHGPSNVTTAVLVLNPYLKHVNIYIKYGRFLAEFRYKSKRLIPKTKMWLSGIFPKPYAYIKKIIK